MRLVLVLLVALAPAVGQISPRTRVDSQLATVAPYGNYAVEGSYVDAQELAADHVLDSGFTTIAANTGNASAETIIGFETAPGGVVAASVSEQATGWGIGGSLDFGSMARTTGIRTPGPHDLRLRIRGAAKGRGKLELWAMGFVSVGARTSITVQVGPDKTVGFTYVAGPGVIFDRRQWDMRLGPNGILDVVIRTDGRAVAATGARATYFSGVTVRFTPGTFATIEPYGRSCAPRLTAYETTAAGAHDVHLDLAGGPASAFGVLVIGSQTWNVPITGTACLLLTDPAATLPLSTDALGGATSTLRLPPVARRLDLRLQEIVVGASGLTSSNGVALTREL